MRVAVPCGMVYKCCKLLMRLLVVLALLHGACPLPALYAVADVLRGDRSACEQSVGAGGARQTLSPWSNLPPDSRRPFRNPRTCSEGVDLIAARPAVRFARQPKSRLLLQTSAPLPDRTKPEDRGRDRSPPPAVPA